MNALQFNKALDSHQGNGAPVKPDDLHRVVYRTRADDAYGFSQTGYHGQAYFSKGLPENPNLDQVAAARALNDCWDAGPWFRCAMCKLKHLMWQQPASILTVSLRGAQAVQVGFLCEKCKAVRLRAAERKAQQDKMDRLQGLQVIK